jgi:hypothetical protein
VLLPYWGRKGLGKAPLFWLILYFLKSYSLYVWIQALDSFISPIPGFEGDIPIPMIPVVARFPRGELASDPSASASAGASKTRVGKHKAMVNPTP